MSEPSLYDLYHELFDVVLARTKEENDIAYQLRYQVYCVETGFLDSTINPGEREIDRFDSHSVQSLLMHKQSGTAAGCVRIILPRPDERGCALPARLAAPVFDTLGSALPLATTTEISRFAISKSFRKRKEDTLYPAANPDGGEVTADGHRRILPHITLGLMAAMMRMSVDNGMTHLCAIIEPALYRLLLRLGLEFKKIGEPIEFHGLRQPVYSSIEDLLDTLRPRQPDVWDVITDCGRKKPIPVE